MRTLVLSFLNVALAITAGSSLAEDTQWMHQAARTMDNGYIVYVASGEDASLEKARFKAQAAAVRSLVNECTLPHKETRVENHFEENADGGYRSYSKVAIQYSDCDEAKRAISPDQIRKLSNRSLAEDQKKYDEMLFGDPDKNHRELAALEAKVEALSESVDALKDQRELAKAKQDLALEPDVYGPDSPDDFNKVMAVIVPKTISMRRNEIRNHKLLPWQRALSKRALRSAYSFKKSSKPKLYSHHAPVKHFRTRSPASKPKKHRKVKTH